MFALNWHRARFVRFYSPFFSCVLKLDLCALALAISLKVFDVTIIKGKDFQTIS